MSIYNFLPQILLMVMACYVLLHASCLFNPGIRTMKNLESSVPGYTLSPSYPKIKYACTHLDELRLTLASSRVVCAGAGCHEATIMRAYGNAAFWGSALLHLLSFSCQWLRGSKLSSIWLTYQVACMSSDRSRESYWDLSNHPRLFIAEG